MKKINLRRKKQKKNTFYQNHIYIIGMTTFFLPLFLTTVLIGSMRKFSLIVSTRRHSLVKIKNLTVFGFLIFVFVLQIFEIVSSFVALSLHHCFQQHQTFLFSKHALTTITMPFIPEDYQICSIGEPGSKNRKHVYLNESFQLKKNQHPLQYSVFIFVGFYVICIYYFIYFTVGIFKL